MRNNVSLHRPLIHASAEGHTNIVGYLKKAGADVGIVSNEGHTAVSLAHKRGHAHTVQVISRSGNRRGSVDLTPGNIYGEEMVMEENANLHAGRVNPKNKPKKKTKKKRRKPTTKKKKKKRSRKKDKN